jgi:hypothetical protein
MKWSAEISNDPIKDFNLYAELLGDGEYKGRIFRDETGELVLVIYGRENVQVPLRWLQSISEELESDL